MSQAIKEFTLLNMVRTGLVASKADVRVLFDKCDEAEARLDELIKNGYVFSRDGRYLLSTAGFRRITNDFIGKP